MAVAAAVYARISDDRTGEGLGVARQLDDCRALAERKGWTVAETFVDNDTSAWGGKPRPEYQRMLEQIKAGTIDGVIVWHLDRLTRRPIELEEFFQVCEAAGVRDLASVTGDVDLSTFDGQFMARILGAVARKESDDKSRRTRRKHLELAQAGKPCGGTRPFGYEKGGLVVREAEAALIREAADRILAGGTLRGICTEWNEAGVPSSRGGRWTQTAIRRILTSWRVAGVRALGDDPVATATWPAILDPVTHRQVRDILLSPGRSRGGFGPRRHALTGLLLCGRCGTKLIARPHRNRRASYICPTDPGKGGCGGLRIVAEPLEQWIATLICERLDRPRLHQALAERRDGHRADDTIAEIHAAEAKLRHLAQQWADDLLSDDEWATARSAVDARLLAARQRLTSWQHHDVAGRHAGDGAPLLERWPQLPLDRRRGLIDALITSITIGPAVPGLGRFDHRRVAITWRA
jgi:site-specific DNA recombinase